MKIAYSDDPQKGPGYGRLIVSEALLPDRPWKIAIQRGSDHAWLAGEASQWVGETLFREVDGAVDQQGNLEISLGPVIVNSLNQMEQYLVLLKGEDEEPIKGRLRVEVITYSPDGMLDNTASVAAPQASHKSGKAPEREMPRSEAGEVQIPPAPNAARIGPDTEKLSMDTAPAAPKNRTIWRWVLLAVLLGALLLWYFLDPGKWREELFSSDKKEPVKIEEPVKKGSESRSATTVALSVNEQVKAFFTRGKPEPGPALELARMLAKNTPEEQDAVYRLYYYAAENGQDSALPEYAACLDPSKPAWGTIGKDAPLAFEAYEKARGAGISGAGEASKHLVEWLKAESAKGNQQAAQWLDQIGEK